MRHPIFRGLALCLTSSILAACGTTQPANDLLSSLNHKILLNQEKVDFERDVRPILERRCVVCHGCYDAPCQLKLESFEGLQRGASKERVYDGSRLLAANLSRLSEDGHSKQDWRNKSFFPVLNETPLPEIEITEAALKQTNAVNSSGLQQSTDYNLINSVLARILILKQEHPQPETPRLPQSMELSLNRNQQCPTLAEFDNYRDQYPLWGMPYGLPQLPQHEFKTLMVWIRNGGKASNLQETKLKDHESESIAIAEKWENFLNGDAVKAQLMARYIYEHLFLATIYFEVLESDGPRPQFYTLVRSRTPAPLPIDRISTRRPFDDPAVARVYYRLQPLQESIAAKRYLPMLLDETKLERYRELFLDTQYSVTGLPGYDSALAANPFKIFEDIPAQVRYKFMLEEAHFYIDGFIKGPVCRGQIALDVINDHFWVSFVDPDIGMSVDEDQFLRKHSPFLILPAGDGSNAIPGLNWRKYANAHESYIRARAEFLDHSLPTTGLSGLDAIWNGDEENTNAALTIFRHFDSASVIRGWLGETPKTAWLIDYPLLERIHYLLVAGFDVYGNVGHQFHTRLYMDFLRIEGEMNFLSLLPEQSREKEWKFWYRGAQEELLDYLAINHKLWHRESGINYTTTSVKEELFAQLSEHLDDALYENYTVASADIDDTLREQLQQLATIPATAANLLPQTMLLMLLEEGEHPQIYSLLHNNGHSNIAHLFSEEMRRLPNEDTLTIGVGIIGSHPNQLLRVPRHQIDHFVAEMKSLNSEHNYRTLLDHYGVRRTDQRFWQYSDDLHSSFFRNQPLRAGILDYNRLENR